MKEELPGSNGFGYVETGDGEASSVTDPPDRVSSNEKYEAEMNDRTLVRERPVREPTFQRHENVSSQRANTTRHYSESVLEHGSFRSEQFSSCIDICCLVAAEFIVVSVWFVFNVLTHKLVTFVDKDGPHYSVALNFHYLSSYVILAIAVSYLINDLYTAFQRLRDRFFGPEGS